MLIVAVLLIKNIRYFRFYSRKLYIQIRNCWVSLRLTECSGMCDNSYSHWNHAWTHWGAHTHTLISNNKIDFLSRFSLSHFIFSQTSSAFAVVQSAIRFLWNFISWKWINRCKRVQVGEWNPHWASRHMQVTGDEKKTLSIELFWVIKGI